MTLTLTVDDRIQGNNRISLWETVVGSYPHVRLVSDYNEDMIWLLARGNKSTEEQYKEEQETLAFCIEQSWKLTRDGDNWTVKPLHEDT
jgi:hypothetical protein